MQRVSPSEVPITKEVREAYQLTGPDAITFTDAARAITDVTGQLVGYVDLTEEAARPRFEGAGLPDWLSAHLAGAPHPHRSRAGRRGPPGAGTVDPRSGSG